MTGLQRSTVSPCSSNMSRNTPCVLGCCGPMLRIIVWSSSGSSGRSWAGAGRCSSPRARFLELHGDDALVVVLAERMAFPVLRHEDAGQVGMVGELDAEHVVHLA